MSQPTRWKVYQSPVEQQQDEARAAAAGWVATSREHLPDGTLRVTYAESGWGAPGMAPPSHAGMARYVQQGIGIGCGLLLALFVVWLALSLVGVALLR